MSGTPGSGIAEKNARKLTPFDRRKLMRELAAGETTRSALAREYGVTPGYITHFAKQYAQQIDAMRDRLDDDFAGLWIADKEARLAAYQSDFEASSSGDYGSHYEQIRTRSAILRNVAEETGQLPSRATTAIIVPVVHQIIGVDLDALK